MTIEQQKPTSAEQQEFDSINAQITNITAQQSELEDRQSLLHDQKQQLIGIRNYIMQKSQAAQEANLAELDTSPIVPEYVEVESSPLAFDDDDNDDNDGEYSHGSVSRSAEYPPE